MDLSKCRYKPMYAVVPRGVKNIIEEAFGFYNIKEIAHAVSEKENIGPDVEQTHVVELGVIIQGKKIWIISDVGLESKIMLEKAINRTIGEERNIAKDALISRFTKEEWRLVNELFHEIRNTVLKDDSK